jgi:pimeloyl-ACP methyl ester carboxylesterase
LVNGSGVPIEGWEYLLPEIQSFGSILVYNRPGVKKSAPPKEPQTGEKIVETLYKLIAELQLKPPYLLVAHSLGGLYINLFARKFPSETAGLVFIDAAHPNDEAMLKEHQNLFARSLNRMFSIVLKKQPNVETDFVHQTVEEIQAAGSFPNIPVVVISGGKKLPDWLMPTKAVEIRTKNQIQLSQLSPQGKRIIAEGSGHFPQISEPKLVAAIIKELIDSVNFRS